MRGRRTAPARRYAPSVWRSLGDRGRILLDVMVAFAVLALGQLDLWGASNGHIVGPRWVSAVTFAVMAGAVALWRRHPLEGLLVALAVFSLTNVVLGSSQALGGFLAATVLAYGVGAHAPRRRALWGLAALVAAMAIHELFDPRLKSLGDFAGALVFDFASVGIWFVGAYVRARRELLAELKDRADRAATEERGRIARELHDLVAHGVTVMVLQAEAADEVLDSDPAVARQAIRKIQATGRTSLSELRTALGLLKQDEGRELSPQPGSEDLADLIRRTESAGLPIEYHWDGDRDIGGALSVSVYRIVQEALTNVLRHAHASAATVSVTVDHAVHIVVQDDGGGPSPDHDGNGLPGIRARAEMFGGSMLTQAVSPHGFRVEVVMPRRPA